MFVVSATVGALALAALFAAGRAAAGGAAVQPMASHGLPVSLDALYPPQAQQPEYLLRMLGLNNLMVGVAIDLEQQEVEHAAAGFAAFKAAYLEVAELVPEWRGRFPAEPVEALGEAIASGDPAQVGPAFGAVGAVCARCCPSL
jgi:hypothetical protein